MDKIIPTPTADELRSLHKQGNVDQLKEALSVLHYRGIRDPQCIPVLGALLSSEDDEVLRLTLGVMMNFERSPRSECFVRLREYLPVFHQVAPKQLGALELIVALAGPSEELVPCLKEYLARFPEETCDVAYQFGPLAKDLVPGLIGLCRNDDWDTIWAAVDALGAIGPAAKEAVPMLEMLTNHKSGLITGRACVALESITGKPRGSWSRGPTATYP
jgi:hypothetical protein